MIPWGHHAPAPVTGGPQQGHQPPAGGQFKDLSRSIIFKILKLSPRRRPLIFQDPLTCLKSGHKINKPPTLAAARAPFLPRRSLPFTLDSHCHPPPLQTRGLDMTRATTDTPLAAHPPGGFCTIKPSFETQRGIALPCNTKRVGSAATRSWKVGLRAGVYTHTCVGDVQPRRCRPPPARTPTAALARRRQRAVHRDAIMRRRTPCAAMPSASRV